MRCRNRPSPRALSSVGMGSQAFLFCVPCLNSGNKIVQVPIKKGADWTRESISGLPSSNQKRRGSLSLLIPLLAQLLLFIVITSKIEVRPSFWPSLVLYYKRIQQNSENLCVSEISFSKSGFRIVRSRVEMAVMSGSSLFLALRNCFWCLLTSYSIETEKL